MKSNTKSNTNSNTKSITRPNTNYSRDIYEKVNPEQAEAIRHKDGPMMVLAGPGSGKTFVITRR